MSDVSTRIVSITVTEKGYYLDPATGKLQLQAPAIAADLATPAAPKTILGLIVQALKNRKRAGIPPFTVLSCDNLPQQRQAGQGRRARLCARSRCRAGDLDRSQRLLSLHHGRPHHAGDHRRRPRACHAKSSAWTTPGRWSPNSSCSG